MTTTLMASQEGECIITEELAFAIFDGCVCQCCLTELNHDNKPTLGNADWQSEYNAWCCTACWARVESNRDAEDNGGAIDVGFDERFMNIWNEAMLHETKYRRVRGYDE